jgi:hypothetical protein
VVCFRYVTVNTLHKGNNNDNNKYNNNKAEKIPKYKDLIIEIHRTWNVKAKMIPVIMEATGTSQNHSHNTRATYRERTKLRKCK